MRYLMILLVAVVPVLVFAHADHDTDSIKTRKALFTLIGANMAALGNMAKGKTEYTAERAQSHASNLGALADYDLGPHFPEGSSMDDHKGETRALAAIWSGRDKFDERWQDYVDATAALEAAAAEGRGAMAEALGRVGATCKGCHDDFRAKDF